MKGGRTAPVGPQPSGQPYFCTASCGLAAFPCGVQHLPATGHVPRTTGVCPFGIAPGRRSLRLGGAPVVAGRTYRTCRLGVWLLGECHLRHGPQRHGPPSSQAVGHILQSSALPSIRLPSLMFLGLPDHPLLVWGFLIFAGSRHCQYLSVCFILPEFILHHGVQVWKSTVSYA